jgi:hypothetical protein
MSEDISDLKDAEKKESNIQYSNNWIGGMILIGIGAIFLLSNLNVFHLNNWWALFILIPAFANFGNVWQSYQQHGRLTGSARGSLTGGIVISLIACSFLFSWNWSVIWPIFLIIGGIGALMNSR